MIGSCEVFAMDIMSQLNVGQAMVPQAGLTGLTGLTGMMPGVEAVTGAQQPDAAAGPVDSTSLGASVNSLSGMMTGFMDMGSVMSGLNDVMAKLSAESTKLLGEAFKKAGVSDDVIKSLMKFYNSVMSGEGNGGDVTQSFGSCSGGLGKSYNGLSGEEAKKFNEYYDTLSSAISGGNYQDITNMFGSDASITQIMNSLK